MLIFFEETPAKSVKSITNTKLSKKQYTDFASYVFGLLLTPEEMRTLKLDISFEKDPDNAGYKGYTMHDSGSSYRIWIRASMSADEQLLTFAHEAVHVKQMMHGELCPNTGRTLSKSLQKMNANQSEEYFDQPCEIEAYGRAVGLVARYNKRSKGIV